MDSWLSQYISSVMELNRLLGLSFVWDGDQYRSVGARTPVGEAVLMAGVFHNQGDYANRNVEIAKLTMLVKHLREIEKHDERLLAEFKRKIRDTSESWGTYWGVRMEINMAASLIRKGVSFVKTESPDFIIPGCGVCIECVSAHKTNSGSANLIDKIRSAIRVKSEKPYCNPSTVLCMDITNIAATDEGGEKELLAQKEEVKRIVKRITEQIRKDTNPAFGSILLFSYFMNLTGSFYSGYWRIDDENIAPDLSDFLNKHFPIGEFNTGPGGTPRGV